MATNIRKSDEAGSHGPGDSALTLVSHSLQHPRLNWDVLTEIMFFLGRADASRMSRTCRTLLRYAPQALLPEDIDGRTVQFKRKRQAASFYNFMLREKQAGFRHLRQLDLTFGFWMYKCWRDLPLGSKFLGALLEHATELQDLSLGSLDLITTRNDTSNNFTRLSKLRTFRIETIHATDVRALELFSRMQSPIAHFETEFHPQADPNAYLASFKDSLEIATLTGANIGLSQVQYPRVRQLTLDLCDIEHIEHAVFSFPNVQQLRINMEELFNDEFAQREILERRAHNSMQQGPGVWSSLRRVEAGAVYILYMAAIRRDIDHLVINPDALRWSNRDRAMLAAVVKDLRPFTLEVSISPYEWELGSLAECLTPAGERLTELRLCLNYGYSLRWPGLHTSDANDTLDALAAVPLHILHMLVLGRELREEDVRYYAAEFDDESWHVELDFEALAQRAMLRIPTLRFLVIEGPTVGNDRLYEIRETEGSGGHERTLVELDKDSLAREHLRKSSVLFANGKAARGDEDDGPHWR